MRMIVTAGVLCAALLLAVTASVHAQLYTDATQSVAVQTLHSPG